MESGNPFKIYGIGIRMSLTGFCGLVGSSHIKSESLTPVLRGESVITPRTPTPFKNALALLERQSGSLRILVSLFYSADLCLAVGFVVVFLTLN